VHIKRACQGGYLAALSICAFASHAGTNEWTPTGPEGGQVHAITWISSQLGVALAVGGNKVYRTADSGSSWTPVLTIDSAFNSRLAVDPTNSNHVLISGAFYAGTIYSSSDGGLTFTPLSSSLSDFPVTLAFSPDGTLLYGGSHHGSIYVSSDQGATWTGTTGLPGSNAYDVMDIEVDPSNHNTVYATINVNFQSGQGGVYRSDNRGQSWSATTLMGDNVFRVAPDPTHPGWVLAAANSGLWLSKDRGDHWEIASSPVSSYFWVGFDPVNPQRVLACGGDTFCVTSPDPSYATWMPTATIFFGYVRDASFNAGRLLVASTDGVHYSADGGETFETRNTGIRCSFTSSLAAANDGVIYAGFSEGLAGVYRADSAGWNLTNIDQQFQLQIYKPLFPGVPDIHSLTVAPTNSKLVYAAAATFNRTTDGGTDWDKPSAQLDGLTVINVLADPKNPQVVYVTTQESGLWRSADGGDSWEKRSAGLPDELGALAIDPVNTNIIYTTGIQNPNTTLYKSTDAGLHWNATGLNGSPILDLTVDPTNTSVLYVVRLDDLYRSGDGGSSWQPLHTRGGYAILVDPEQPGDLFLLGSFLPPGASKYGSGMLRSVDAGTSWEPILMTADQSSTWLARGILDPLRPQHIIAASGSEASLMEFEAAPDLQLAIESLPTTLTGGGTATATIRTKNNGPFGASGVSFKISLPSWLSVASLPSGCSQNGVNVQCSVGPINSGMSASIPITLAVADTQATGSFIASVSGHEMDPDMSNNTVSVSLSAVAAPPSNNPGSSPGSSGGGGSVDLFGLTGLVMCLCLRPRRRDGAPKRCDKEHLKRRCAVTSQSLPVLVPALVPATGL
jgi:photosystem II stability/assembly factor-like uncharacterized protein